MQKAIFIPLALSLFLVACAEKAPDLLLEEPSLPLTLPEDCREVWIYGPGRYILELAEGNDVFLEPRYHDFPLFCSSAEAEKDLDTAIKRGELPQGDWALYRVEGTMSDLAKQTDKGLFLKIKAPLCSWELIQKTNVQPSKRASRKKHRK